MAAIGGSVAVASALAPRPFLRLFGTPAADITPAAVLGWRLFAVRTAALTGLAAAGSATARDVFLPVQVLDQLSWWTTPGLPARTRLMATTASGAIVALDLRRRLAG